MKQLFIQKRELFLTLDNWVQHVKRCQTRGTKIDLHSVHVSVFEMYFYWHSPTQIFTNLPDTRLTMTLKGTFNRYVTSTSQLEPKPLIQFSFATQANNFDFVSVSELRYVRLFKLFSNEC